MLRADVGGSEAVGLLLAVHDDVGYSFRKLVVHIHRLLCAKISIFSHPCGSFVLFNSKKRARVAVLPNIPVVTSGSVCGVSDFSNVLAEF